MAQRTDSTNAGKQASRKVARLMSLDAGYENAVEPAVTKTAGCQQRTRADGEDMSTNSHKSGRPQAHWYDKL